MRRQSESRARHHLLPIRWAIFVTVLGLILLYGSIFLVSWSDRRRQSCAIFIMSDE